MRFQRLAWIVGTALFAATTTAYARPDTRTMTCDETQRLIQSHHSAVLTTGQNTYDRYVRQFGNDCDWPEVPVAASVPTRDGQCRVYWCREPVFDFPNRRSQLRAPENALREAMRNPCAPRELILRMALRGIAV